ncbi:MAG: aldehyde dehydrogenase [Parcubacteria group bacterium]|nr:aldehyde dehydrogenase [Parcubacteria group bacterium]
MSKTPKMTFRTTPFINGEYIEANTNERHALLNPTTGKLLTEVAIGSPEDIAHAVRAAHNAFPLWRDLSVHERRKILFQFSVLVHQHAETLALLDAQNIGKAIIQCTGESKRGAGDIVYFAKEAGTQELETFTGKGKYNGEEKKLFNTVSRVPVGVAGIIVPWNTPVTLSLFNAAPALAYGNTVIVKPSLWAPLSILALGELANEAGIPEGVLNIVPGDAPAGDALVRNPLVSRVAFTGSVAVGKLVHKANGEVWPPRPLALELGGKGANIVFADCDVETTVRGVATSIWRSQGQSCVAPSRLLIQREIYNEFISKLVAVTRKLNIGDPTNPETEYGPLINATHLENVLCFIESGKSEGAKLIFGGEKILGRGCFLLPTIFADVMPHMTIFQEEIFGPVLSVTPFDTESEAIALANATRYGLASNIWTNDSLLAERVARQIDVGMMWRNAHFVRCPEQPFGGMRESGLGRQGGKYWSRDFYTVPKFYCTLEE